MDLEPTRRSGGEPDTGEVVAARERARRALFDAPSPPRAIGRYELLERLGEGGMGTVYAARDPELRRKVAIKVLRADVGGSTRKRRLRLLAEARAMAKLSHPNIVVVYEVGTDEQGPGQPPLVFIAMELVEGQTLRRWHETTRPSTDRVLAAYVEAASGLAALHAAGLIHRDFKPDNAMIDRAGRVRVMDLGLARDTGEADLPTSSPAAAATMIGKLTQTGALLGTPGYMAPEQFEGAAGVAASDQYALCVALYEALWGRRPFLAATPTALAHLVTSDDPPPPTSLNGVSRGVRDAVLRGLARDPGARWPSMDALIHALTHRRRRRRSALVLGGLAIAGAAWWATGTLPATSCKDSEAAFDGTWNDRRRAAVGESFAAASPLYGARAAEHTISAFDRYREAWASAHQDACRATRIEATRSEDELDGSMRCLAKRRREANALVGALMTADSETIDFAATAVARLVPPARCSEEAFVRGEYEPLSDPAEAARLAALEGELATVEATFQLGHPERALELGQAVVEGAQRLGYAPFTARAQVQVARIVADRDSGPRGIEHLRGAYFVAREAGEARASALAAIELASLLGSTAYPDRAVSWLHHARSVVAASELADLEPMLLGAEATIAEYGGDLDTSIRLVKAQLSLVRERCDDRPLCPGVGPIHDALATLQQQAGDATEALRNVELAVEAIARLDGGTHPNIAGPLMRKGELLLLFGRPGEAVDALRQCWTLREQRFGAEHLNTVGAQSVLASALIRSGQRDAGLAMLDAAADAARRATGPNQASAILNRAGLEYVDAGRLHDAKAAYTDSARLLEEAHPDGHRAQSIIASNVAYVESERGDHAAALAGYQRALAIREGQVSGRDTQRAVFLYNIAKELQHLDRLAEAVAPLQEATSLLAHEDLRPPMVAIARTLAAVLRPTSPDEAERVLARAHERCLAATPEAREGANCSKLGPPFNHTRSEPR